MGGTQLLEATQKPGTGCVRVGGDSASAHASQERAVVHRGSAKRRESAASIQKKAAREEGTKLALARAAKRQDVERMRRMAETNCGSLGILLLLFCNVGTACYMAGPRTAVIWLLSWGALEFIPLNKLLRTIMNIYFTWNMLEPVTFLAVYSHMRLLAAFVLGYVFYVVFKFNQGLIIMRLGVPTFDPWAGPMVARSREAKQERAIARLTKHASEAMELPSEMVFFACVLASLLIVLGSFLFLLARHS
uniref:Uncharacterized protein n=1 Tax=Coccolithus braarudii TaxID=221442 RepID=A0A7S0Q8H4_9EUKA|mmetsp:Transcript_53053/g.113406  ORF Transcript_53053/g.113406 Transcript_53053/m.113406 type:complete len:248 (+) Transcript_53053:112-855(+)